MATTGTSKRRGMNTMGLVMLGYGSIIGAGLFVASGVAVKQAGPAVLLAFLIGAVAFKGVLSALAEMATADESPGGLRAYAKASLGPWMGFTIGWMYWASGVFTMSSEVTAAALIAHTWLPHLPLWTFSLVFSILITGINFMDARGFGEVETLLAGVKIVALIGFILVGGYFLLRGGHAGLAAIQASGTGLARIFPTGLTGFVSAMLMVMFTYAGVQTVAMAGPETEDPDRVIPRGIRILTTSVVLLYVAAFTVLILLMPWRDIDTATSPFIQALQRVGLTGLQFGLGLVVLTAALSSLNSSLFAVSRMLRTLAVEGEAPAPLGRSTAGGLPGWSLAASGITLMISVLLSYWLPSRAYLLITSTSGFTGMFNWTVIALCHIRYRPILMKKDPESLVYKAWGYPWYSWLTMAITVAVMLTTPLHAGQRVGFLIGIAEFGVISLLYLAIIRGRHPAGPVRRTELFRPELPPQEDQRLRE